MEEVQAHRLREVVGDDSKDTLIPDARVRGTGPNTSHTVSNPLYSEAARTCMFVNG